MQDDAKTVLVIDDHDDERAIQRAILGHFGYRVVDASDGAEGLRIARESRPNLILLDVAMPRLDGFSVCRELRADPATHAIPVVLFTASLAAEIDERAEAAGATAILTKPIDPQRVAAEIARLIGPGTGAGDGASRGA